MTTAEVEYQKNGAFHSHPLVCSKGSGFGLLEFDLLEFAFQGEIMHPWCVVALRANVTSIDGRPTPVVGVFLDIVKIFVSRRRLEGLYKSPTSQDFIRSMQP